MKKLIVPPTGKTSKKSIDDILTIKDWQEMKGTFPKEVYEKLPDVLRLISNVFETDQEHATALFCSLILISGALPYYHTIYDRRTYEANLYGYVIGNFGSGKGTLNFCRKIVEPLHKEKVERSKKYREWYFLNKDTVEPTPPLPKEEMHIVPGNITKPKIYQALKENDERLSFIETETDTLSSANKSEHGNFSDLLRAALEHEPVSVSRKTDGTIYIERPCITALLSSTPNQLYGLIPHIENGLFSRFAYLPIVSDRKFKKVFDTSGIDPNEMMGVIGEFVFWLHDELIGSLEDVVFSFTDEQQSEFYEYFTQMKNEYFDIYGSEMDGVVHRLGLMFTRIAMILSILRIFDLEYERLDLPPAIVCNRRDFDCVKLIVDTLSENSHEVYALLMKGKAERQNTTETATLGQKLEMHKKCVEMFHQGCSHSEIAKAVLGNAALKGTIHKWLKKSGLTNGKK